MKTLGFRYHEQGKSFYVDNHESLPNIKYREAFSDRYLREYEPYMPRWFQISTKRLMSEIPREKLEWVMSLGRSIPEEEKS